VIIAAEDGARHNRSHDHWQVSEQDGFFRRFITAQTAEYFLPRSLPQSCDRNLGKLVNHYVGWHKTQTWQIGTAMQTQLTLCIDHRRHTSSLFRQNQSCERIALATSGLLEQTRVAKKKRPRGIHHRVTCMNQVSYAPHRHDGRSQKRAI
jgi:hypothetical protein